MCIWNKYKHYTFKKGQGVIGSTGDLHHTLTTKHSYHPADTYINLYMYKKQLIILKHWSNVHKWICWPLPSNQCLYRQIYCHPPERCGWSQGRLMIKRESSANKIVVRPYLGYIRWSIICILSKILQLLCALSYVCVHWSQIRLMLDETKSLGKKELCVSRCWLRLAKLRRALGQG